jgi:hypothetical protein
MRCVNNLFPTLEYNRIILIRLSKTLPLVTGQSVPPNGWDIHHLSKIILDQNNQIDIKITKTKLV